MRQSYVCLPSWLSTQHYYYWSRPTGNNRHQSKFFFKGFLDCTCQCVSIIHSGRSITGFVVNVRSQAIRAALNETRTVNKNWFILDKEADVNDMAATPMATHAISTINNARYLRAHVTRVIVAWLECQTWWRASVPLSGTLLTSPLDRVPLECAIRHHELILGQCLAMLVFRLVNWHIYCHIVAHYSPLTKPIKA